jgi:hypothetical protein
MKISLIDFDNTGFPNLALMKISTYYKNRGDEVKFYEPLFDKPDVIYGSKVFLQTDFSIPNEKCQVNLGGTGFNYKKSFCLIKEFVLRPEIEHICPDYDLIDVCNWCNLKKIFAQCKNYEEYRNQKKRRHLCK